MRVLLQLTEETALLELHVEALQGAVNRFIGLYGYVDQNLAFLRKAYSVTYFRASSEARMPFCPALARRTERKNACQGCSPPPEPHGQGSRRLQDRGLFTFEGLPLRRLPWYRYGEGVKDAERRVAAPAATPVQVRRRRYRCGAKGCRSGGYPGKGTAKALKMRSEGLPLPAATLVQVRRRR